MENKICGKCKEKHLIPHSKELCLGCLKQVGKIIGAPVEMFIPEKWIAEEIKEEEKIKTTLF